MGLQQITGNEIAAGSIAASDLASASITGDKLGATSINANNIVGGTITTTQIASNTISNTNIQTGAIENYSRATGLLSGMRNRIINGAMVIDQRNAGANVTQETSETYSLDRFLGYGNITSKFTMQQSSTAPAGFVNSVVITSSAATVVGSSDQYYFAQKIEGFNTADLGWGSASAKTVCLSFWARASVIGTYSVFLLNNGSAYSYVANYTISVADTFEYKTITIVAPTVGTWLTTNGLGIYLGWDLGSGSTLNQTAGSWQAGNKRATSGSTQLVATSGATLYLTGVQLEVGSTATSFDYRPYGTELALCQRYFFKAAGTNGLVFNANYSSAQFKVTMRATPTVTVTPNSGVVSSIGPDADGFFAENTTTSSATYTASIEL